jgi:hypothetical protein
MLSFLFNIIMAVKSGVDDIDIDKVEKIISFFLISFITIFYLLYQIPQLISEIKSFKVQEKRRFRIYSIVLSVLLPAVYVYVILEHGIFVINLRLLISFLYIIFLTFIAIVDIKYAINAKKGHITSNTDLISDSSLLDDNLK